MRRQWQRQASREAEKSLELMNSHHSMPNTFLRPQASGSPAFSHMKFLSASAAWFLAVVSAAAAPDGEWNPDTTFPALSPAEAVRTIEVPPGYKLQCVASEPMVEEPAMIAFDGNGSLYVCEWRTYMQDEHATGQLDPASRVVKLTDTDGDGVMDQRTVFLDNVVLPRSVLPMGDRVLVVFTESSTVWACFDDNKDGVCDRREVAWQGSEDHGNIEHQSSGLLWNLDNTVCTNDYRFRWDGGKLTEQRHATSRISQWGLARDDDGRLVCSWGGGANPAHSFQLPAGYPIVQVNEHAPDYGRPWGNCPVWDFSDGGYDIARQAQLLNFSATCGQSVLRSPLLSEWYGNAVTCEPVGRLIRMSRFEWKDGLGVACNAFPGKEFIRSTDAYFRPVWTTCGPDGALYIADLYRGIIQEKEWFPTEVSPELQARFVEPYRKDKLGLWVERYHRLKKWDMIKVVRHGRIYRLVPDGKPPGKPPRMLDESPVRLVAHLANPDGWWRDTAQMLLVSRGDQSAVPALMEMAGNHDDANARIHAMWTLRGLDRLTKELILQNLTNPSARVRRAAVQLAEPFLIQKDPGITAALSAMRDEKVPEVTIQLFLAFRAAASAAGEPVSANNPIKSVPALPVITALNDADRAEALRGPLGDSARRGRIVYESLCIACHGVDGNGVEVGGKFLAPPLGSSSLASNPENLPALARILLKGLTGPIDGRIYGEGLMPPLEKSHSDGQLADVLTYVGERWHQWENPVDPETITRIRAEITGRQSPWIFEDLKPFRK